MSDIWMPGHTYSHTYTIEDGTIRWGSTTTNMNMIERRGKPRTEEKRETNASKLNPLWQLDQELKAIGGTDDAVQG
jgi:hypothetical protein